MRVVTGLYVRTQPLLGVRWPLCIRKAIAAAAVFLESVQENSVPYSWESMLGFVQGLAECYLKL
jgi:hypothetical protein